MTTVHWSWLHGPETNPDPRVGDMSLSAASRVDPWAGPPRVPWDDWLHEQIRNLAARPPETGAA